MSDGEPRPFRVGDCVKLVQDVPHYWRVDRVLPDGRLCIGRYPMWHKTVLPRALMLIREAEEEQDDERE